MLIEQLVETMELLTRGLQVYLDGIMLAVKKTQAVSLIAAQLPIGDRLDVAKRFAADWEDLQLSLDAVVGVAEIQEFLRDVTNPPT